MNSQEQIAHIHKALEYIAAQCDGVVSRDGVGFSAFTRDGGIKLVRLPAEQWTQKELAQGWNIANTHKGQLPAEYILGPKPAMKFIRPCKEPGYFKFGQVGKVDMKLNEPIKSLPDWSFNKDGDFQWRFQLPLQRSAKFKEWAIVNGIMFIDGAEEHFATCPDLDAPKAPDPDIILISEPETVSPIQLQCKIPYRPDHLRLEFKLALEVGGQKGWRFLPDDKLWVATINELNVVGFIDYVRKYKYVLAAGIMDRLQHIYALGEVKKADMDLAYHESVALEPTWMKDFPFGKNGLSVRPYQLAGVQYLLGSSETTDIAAIIGDAVGLGKTITSLCACEYIDAFPLLVVMPSGVKLNWRDEALRWLRKADLTFKIVKGRKALDTYGNCDVTFINYDILYDHQDGIIVAPFKGVIFDEAQRIKNLKSQRAIAARNIMAMLKHQLRARLLLSGTIVPNRPEELVNALAILDALYVQGFNDKTIDGKQRYSNEFPFQSKSWFLERFCGGHKTDDGHYVTTGAQNLEQLNEMLRVNRLYLRRTANKALHLPPKTRQYITVPIDNFPLFAMEAADVLQWIVDDHDTQERHTGKATYVMGAPQMTKVMHLISMSAQGKVPSIIDLADTVLEGGEKIVIFAHTIALQDRLFEIFTTKGKKDGYSVAHIKGGMNADKSHAQQVMFREDPHCKVIICSNKAAGEGINLQVTSKMILTECPWTAAEIEQEEGRIYRSGQEEAVTIYDLKGEGTLDHWLAGIVDGKKHVMDTIQDGSYQEVPTRVLSPEGYQDLITQLAAMANEKTKEAEIVIDEEEVTELVDNDMEKEDTAPKPAPKVRRREVKAPAKEAIVA